MKPTTNIVERTSTFEGGEHFSALIDPESLPHILSLLTGIYSDAEKALIREVISNAKDSHVAAGQTRPIVVTAPSALDRTFVVQDFGVGMSLDELKEIFSSYGRSTKRDTNDAIGAFGIGAKSPLAYTSQFTLRTVKDGVRLSTLVSRSSDGGVDFHVVDTQATDEPNGVTVKVPVHTSMAEFAENVSRFLMYWDKSEYELIGTQRREHQPALVDDRFFAYSRYTDGVKNLVLMGGVTYPFWSPVSNDYFLVLRANIGDVDVTPSREELMLTPKTQRWVDEAVTYARQRVSEAVDETIEAAPTHVEAKELWKTYSGIKPYGYTPHYRGEEIPSSIEGSDAAWTVGDKCAEYTYSPWPNNHAQPIIYNFPRKRLTTKDKAIIRANFAFRDRVFIYRGGDPTKPWFDGAYDKCVDWNDIKDTAVQIAPRPPAAPKSTHMTLTVRRGGRVYRDKIDTEEPVYILVNSQEDRAHLNGVYRVPLDKLHKFKTRYPKAVPYADQRKQENADWITKNGEIALACRELDLGLLDTVDWNEIEDPWLQKILGLHAQPLGGVRPDGWNGSPEAMSVKAKAEALENDLRSRYPLALCTRMQYFWGDQLKWGERVKQDAVKYVNQTFKEQV